MLEYFIKDHASPASGCIIWMHGLGADASDMAGIAEQYPIAKLPFRHVFMNAPMRPVTLNAGMRMRAWYDIYGLELTDREDRQGILQARSQVLEMIHLQLDAGFTASQIMLAGFSQGGAMALNTALHFSSPLAGVIALSAYFPLASECIPVLPKETPFFLGFGQFDTLVLPEWTRQSKRFMVTKGYNQITLKQYPVEHAVCSEEIADIASWLSIHLRGVVTV